MFGVCRSLFVVRWLVIGVSCWSFDGFRIVFLLFFRLLVGGLLVVCRCCRLVYIGCRLFFCCLWLSDVLVVVC